MDLPDLKYEINSVLRPERDDEGSLSWDMPHPRLFTIHGLDTSYYRGPFEIDGDGSSRLELEGAGPFRSIHRCIDADIAASGINHQRSGNVVERRNYITRSGTTQGNRTGCGGFQRDCSRG